MEIPITPNQAMSLRSDIQEINQFTQIREMKLAAHARHRDTIALDAGIDPTQIETYEVKEIGGQSYLIATPKEPKE